MAVIAVAGGKGSGLGRAVVTACAANTKHRVIVLSRIGSKTPPWLEQSGVEVRRVDYFSEESLRVGLEVFEPHTWASSQINLLHAGLAAGISRFISSDWGLGPLTPPQIELLHPQVEVWKACREAAITHVGKFEWASFHLGLFMNYLGWGCPREEALNGLTDDTAFIFDIKNMRASIPLTREGKTPRITMTELSDVGKFTSAAAELPFGHWKEHMGMVGDMKRMDEIVSLIERARGKKMEVAYRPFEKIQSEAKVEHNALAKMWLNVEEAFARDQEGEGVFIADLNEALKEVVKPMSIKEYLEMYWAGV